MSNLFTLFTSCAAVLHCVSAHGHLAHPASRNAVHGVGPAFPSGTTIGPGNVQNLNAGVGGGYPGLEKERAQGHGLCGDDSLLRRFMAPNQYGPAAARVPDASVFVEGSTVDFEVVITAHHKGWFEFRLCRPADGGADTSVPITQACLNQHVLKFDVAYTRSQGHGYTMEAGVSDPTDYAGINHGAKCQQLLGAPEGTCCNNGGNCSPDNNNDDRWVLPIGIPSGGRYTMRYRLPEGVTCERCVLQWTYFTGNSVWNFPEAFYNCADITINPRQGSVPTSPPTNPHTNPTNPPTPLANPGSSCSGAPCANTSHCRSTHGYCGGSSDYCNAQSTWTSSCVPASGCTGAPCANTSHCRSKHGYCGGSSAYCNSESTWTSACRASSGCTGAPCSRSTHCRSKYGYCGGSAPYCNSESTWTSSCP